MSADGRRGISRIARAVAIGASARHVKAVAPPGSHGVLPGRTNCLVRHTAISHEVWGEQIQRSGCFPSEIGVWDVPRILGPIPVVQRQLRIDLTQARWTSVAW